MRLLGVMAPTSTAWKMSSTRLVDTVRRPSVKTVSLRGRTPLSQNIIRLR